MENAKSREFKLLELPQADDIVAPKWPGSDCGSCNWDQNAWWEEDAAAALRKSEGGSPLA